MLDVAFQEDDCRIRCGDAAQNFAILRRIALNVGDTNTKLGIAYKRLKAGWDVFCLSRLLGLWNQRLHAIGLSERGLSDHSILACVILTLRFHGGNIVDWLQRSWLVSSGWHSRLCLFVYRTSQRFSGSNPELRATSSLVEQQTDNLTLAVSSAALAVPLEGANFLFEPVLASEYRCSTGRTTRRGFAWLSLGLSSAF